MEINGWIKWNNLRQEYPNCKTCEKHFSPTGFDLSEFKDNLTRKQKQKIVKAYKENCTDCATKISMSITEEA